jgi:hypothetical protein
LKSYEIDALVLEIKKSPRASRLDRISAERNPHVLGRFVLASRGVEQMEAIEAIRQLGRPEAEPYLIEMIQGPPDRFAFPGANAALASVGSAAAIPHLTRLIHSPIEDVKQSAINALASVGDASLTPLFLDALADRSWGAKWYAMKAIHDRADERAIGPVVERVKVILTRKPKTNIGGWSELMYAVDFLRLWSDRSEVARSTLKWADGRREFMRDPERAWYDRTFRSAADLASGTVPAR